MGCPQPQDHAARTEFHALKLCPDTLGGEEDGFEFNEGWTSSLLLGSQPLRSSRPSTRTLNARLSTLSLRASCFRATSLVLIRPSSSAFFRTSLPDRGTGLRCSGGIKNTIPRSASQLRTAALLRMLTGKLGLVFLLLRPVRAILCNRSMTTPRSPWLNKIP